MYERPTLPRQRPRAMSAYYLRRMPMGVREIGADERRRADAAIYAATRLAEIGAVVRLAPMVMPPHGPAR